MSVYEELPLFGEPDEQVPATVPPLPNRPLWSRHAGSVHDRCTYCVWAAAADALALVRSPVWQRVGVDGAVMLLCGWHSRLFDQEYPQK